MRSLRKWLVVGVVIEWVAWLLILWSGGSPVGRALRLAVVCLVGSLTVAALRSWRSRWWPAAALPAGLLGVVAGSGVGPRHLSAGAVVAGTAGTVLMAVGLAVVVASTVSILRSVRPRSRLWVVPAAVAALVMLLPSVVAVAASDPPPTPLSGRTPADVGVEAAVVEFPARDGTVLIGWSVPSRNGAAVALLHGSGSNRESVLDHLAVLAGAGYGVLAFDARGHGDSAGSGMDLGWHGEDDLGGALDHLASQPGIDPGRLGAVGLSMGGEEALALLGDPLLHAVVAEGATGRGAADDGWKPTHLGGLVQRVMDRWQDRLASVLTGLSPPPSLRTGLAASGAPVLLVTAGDRPDEEAAARWMQEVAPTSVDVWVIAGASHAGGLEQDRSGWSGRVLSFLDQTLGPVSP